MNAEWDCASLVRGEDQFGHFEASPVPRFDFDPIAMAHHEKATDAIRALLFQGAEQVRTTV
jgi:hypothetical protein